MDSALLAIDSQNVNLFNNVLDDDFKTHENIVIEKHFTEIKYYNWKALR